LEVTSCKLEFAHGNKENSGNLFKFTVQRQVKISGSTVFCGRAFHSPLSWASQTQPASFTFVRVKLIATTVFLWKDFVDFGERTAVKPTALVLQSPFRLKNQRCFLEISTNHKIR